MSMQTWQEVIMVGTADGPPLTAAAAASCIPTGAKFTLPSNYFQVGKAIRITLMGRISCAVTTPGTARFDVRLGASGSTVVFDTGALNLNIVAKVNVPFVVEIELHCRAAGAGTTTTFMGVAKFTSEAVVGSPLPAAGSNGTLLAPVTAPAVGAGFDNTAASILDVFFTQTVATGSLTVHTYKVESLN
jgi:hypothetical protein